MSTKTIVMLAAIIGSIIGGYVPVLFGADAFSFSSILFSGIGGIVAILIALKISN